MTKEEIIKEAEKYLKAEGKDEEYIRAWKSAFLAAIKTTTQIDGKSLSRNKGDKNGRT